MAQERARELGSLHDPGLLAPALASVSPFVKVRVLD